MTPEQAHFLLHEIYLPQIRSEQEITRRVIEAVPAERSDYKPDEKSMSAWQLACHIATSEMFFMSGATTALTRRFPSTSRLRPGWRAGTPKRTPKRPRNWRRFRRRIWSRTPASRFSIFRRFNTWR
jgi:hypothetical protein